MSVLRIRRTWMTCQCYERGAVVVLTFCRLQERISQPSASGGQCSVTFPGHQRFFRDFIVVAANPVLNHHLSSLLSIRITEVCRQFALCFCFLITHQNYEHKMNIIVLLLITYTFYFLIYQSFFQFWFLDIFIRRNYYYCLLKVRCVLQTLFTDRIPYAI